MFSIGDLIIYSAHGICQIDDICKKTYFGAAKDYYVLHPVENSSLIINVPTDNHKVIMHYLIGRNEAEEILESFKLPGIDWIEIDNQRSQTYQDIVKKGNRKEISKIVNTLMRKKRKTEVDGKKFYEIDNRLLIFVQDILFAELAISLNTTIETIYEKIDNFININPELSNKL